MALIISSLGSGTAVPSESDSILDYDVTLEMHEADHCITF